MNDLQEVMRQADGGDEDAMYWSALKIIWGDQTTAPEPGLAEKAVEYYSLLAQTGHCDSMLDLGAMYLDGRGVEKNEDKALAWYMKASDKLYPKAYRCIGNFWLIYSEKAPDIARAFDAFAKGALFEEQNSLYMLGDFYREGEYIDKDVYFAFALYRAAERVIARNDLGFPDGDITCDDCYSAVQLRLGECYLDGIGTKADIEQAARYLQPAVTVYERRIAEGDNPSGVNSKELIRAQEKLAETVKRKSKPPQKRNTAG